MRLLNSGLLSEVFSRIRRAFQVPYYGFVQGHAHLSADDFQRIGSLVGVDNNLLVAEFERQFAKLVGSGRTVSFAAARMGFYELMRLNGIGKGDEVILTGATCSVMVNAIMRLEAMPIFADSDPATFGSSCEAIAACVTNKTRMIVAQHSFGIPCDIEPIADLALKKNIFLLEDCALTLGSEINGVPVGNFGDAALFSTDHSKPLNTLIGGLVYTQNTRLAECLKDAQSRCPELSVGRQRALWKRLLLEAHYCVPARYGKMGLIDIYLRVRRKLIRAEPDLLIEDGVKPSTCSYPYPAKYPAFLAALGLIEIERWPQIASDRSAKFEYLLGLLAESRSGAQLPAAYKNKALKIIPLRLAWFEPDGARIRRAMRRYIDVSWTWFMAPVIATKEPIENFGYRKGSCPVSESVGPCMVNIPCNIDREVANKLISLIREQVV